MQLVNNLAGYLFLATLITTPQSNASNPMYYLFDVLLYFTKW